MVNIYWLRPKVGEAIWLWNLLNGFITYNAANQWFVVAEGRPISDLNIGSFLFCADDTVRTWRERLETLGLIRCTLLPEADAFGHECRKIEVVNVNFGAPAAAGPPLGSTAIH